MLDAEFMDSTLLSCSGVNITIINHLKLTSNLYNIIKHLYINTLLFFCLKTHSGLTRD